MKKLIYFIFIIILVLSCTTTRTTTINKVTVPKYVRFSKFNKDTAAYIKQNFENRKQYYIGKEFKVLLNDLELPFKSASLHNMMYKYEGKGRYSGGVFYFYDEDKYFKVADNKDFIPGILVKFAPPYLEKDTILFLSQKYSNSWNKENRKIMEKQIVESVEYFNRAQWTIKNPKK